MNLGDIQLGERRDFPFDVFLCSTSPVESQLLASCELRYVDVETSGERVEMCEIRVSRPVICSKYKPNLLVVNQVNRELSADTLAKSSKLIERNEFKRANELLSAASASIYQSAARDDSFSRQLVSDLNEIQSNCTDANRFQQQGQFELHSMSSGLSAQ